MFNYPAPEVEPPAEAGSGTQPEPEPEVPVAGPSGSQLLEPLAGDLDDALGLGNLASLPEPPTTIVEDIQEEVEDVIKDEEQVEVEEDGEADVMDVDEEEEGEVKPASPAEVVDLTLEDGEAEDDDDDDDVVILDAPPQQPSPALSVHSPVKQADALPLEVPITAEEGEVEEVPATPPTQVTPEDHEASVDAEGEEDTQMQDVEEEIVTVVPEAVPTPQATTIEPALIMAGPPPTAEPPPPMSRTASGQYSLSSLPPSVLFSPSYTFAAESTADLETRVPARPQHNDFYARVHTLNDRFTLPPLNALPSEFQRKAKTLRQLRKREKDKDKGDGKAQGEWAPMGINKWGAVIRANPLYKRAPKATKCMSTRDWNVSFKACHG